jgi:hypothetical protein
MDRKEILELKKYVFETMISHGFSFETTKAAFEWFMEDWNDHLLETLYTKNKEHVAPSGGETSSVFGLPPAPDAEFSMAPQEPIRPAEPADTIEDVKKKEDSGKPFSLKEAADYLGLSDKALMMRIYKKQGPKSLPRNKNEPHKFEKSELKAYKKLTPAERRALENEPNR